MVQETLPARRREALLRFQTGNSKSLRRIAMPLVNVKLIEGVFTPAQKRDMIRKLTDTMVSIEGENMRPVTVVVLEEVRSGDWGVGGTPYTTEEVKRLAAGKGPPTPLT
jgi:4-oxalocrotonate tautomerase